MKDMIKETMKSATLENGMEILVPQFIKEGEIIRVDVETMKNGDTVGGIFEVIVTGLPVGLGSYVQWDRSLDGLLAQAIMSILAV